MIMRAPTESDLEPLADLWRAGWCDGHLAIVPEALVRLRTGESFRDRLRARWDALRVAGPEGAPTGFHLILGDELNQFYLAAAARGTGLASAMMKDAEARLRASGVRRAWLACAIGNDRAARFYEKAGWVRTCTEAIATQTSEGPFPLQVWRFERELG